MTKPVKNKLSFVQAFEAWRKGGHKQPQRFEKSESALWYETINPLRGLTADKAAQIYDRARLGVYSDLQWLYQEIEGADPTLFTCTENREAAIELAEWRVVLSNPERIKGFEENLAKEQQDFLSQAYGACGDEMESLTAHLERGFFRGYAHARPVYSADGNDVTGFELYDQWNFARDPSTGEWWWNPDAVSWANENFIPIPEGELITLCRSRHIDYPSLAVFIRAALGDKKWGVFMDRFGIPPVTIVMPEFADKTEEAAYMSAAQKLAAAGSGALPFGSTVNYATDARGTNPFTEFLRHQQELTVLMATGGLLTTLTAPDSGTLAGSAHTDTWMRVVGRDLRSVGRAVNRTVTSTLLSHRFPGQPHLAGIEFSTTRKPSSGEVLEDATKAKTAGYLIDQADLEEKTGYKLKIDTSTSAPTGFNFANKQNLTRPVANKDTDISPERLERIVAPIAELAADPTQAALKVFESGGTEAEAMAAFDAAAKAALTAEAIAASAEAINQELEAAVKEGKGVTE